MMDHELTIQLNIWDEDILSTPNKLLHPMPTTGILETVHITFSENQWHVTSAEPEAPKVWAGHGEYKIAAILDYLKARLGMYKTESEVQP